MKYLTYITENPVVLLDIIKYAIAALVLFGVPVPPGVDVAIAGAVLGALTLITRAVVVPLGKHNTAVEDALAMTPPGDTGEAEYVAAISPDGTPEAPSAGNPWFDAQ
ncbi:hypothetical protein [Micromonospora andamanensis]|uniref:hypothetical protein n=1 Tax=Micromonospora andamanensis TaxID=1287068 RepID=UPI00194F4963|nr:hypothetical protein [Micromonospora andamanensis]GIJ38515.1 hypothetical protein Vwe01_18400 [Micromonospora andamanensis]